MKKTMVELFAGVGGFRCGLNHVKLKNNVVTEEPRWECLWANQWEPSTKTQSAFKCYNERFPSKSNINKDIAQVDKNTIPDMTLLVGGFPCQDYSVARTKCSAKGIEGKKGVLWWQIAEIIEAKKPPFILLENVDRLLRSPASQRGRDFAIMLKTLDNNHYNVEWKVINAADYGLPQKRRRTFIFASHKSTKYYTQNMQLLSQAFHQTQISDKSTLCIRIVGDLLDISENFKWDFANYGYMHNGQVTTFKVEANYNGGTSTLGSILQDTPIDEKRYIENERLERWRYLKGAKSIPRGKYTFREGALVFPDKLDIPARTMLTSESTCNRSSHVVKDVTGRLRTLTPLEAERINMFPDNWTDVGISDRQRFLLMGNALVVGVVQRLGEYIEKVIDQED